MTPIPPRETSDRPRMTGSSVPPAARKPLTSRRAIIPTFSETIGSFLLEVGKVVIISLAIIIPIRYFLIQPFYVKGASMEPNFYDSEYLVVDEISYRLHTPNRGDVIVLRNPRSESDFLIKRVIGLPGERIEIINGEIHIFNSDHPNSFTINESSYLPSSAKTIGTYDYELKSNEYYVLGDNREASLDSRIFGPATRREIVGRAWVRAWPVTRLNVFSTPNYQQIAIPQGTE